MFQEAWHEIDGCGHVGTLVFCFWEMKTWEMLWGKGGQFEGFWIHAAFHTATVCLNLRWHYGQEVNLRPQEPKEADASGLSAGNMETSKSPALVNELSSLLTSLSNNLHFLYLSNPGRLFVADKSSYSLKLVTN